MQLLEGFFLLSRSNKASARGHCELLKKMKLVCLEVVVSRKHNGGG